MWPSYSGGIKSQLIGALRFLGLIGEEGLTTPALRSLAEADSQHRPALFKAVMKNAYAGLMALDLTKATPGSFDAEMRKYGLEGDTHRKASSFFLQAARWAGIPLSPLLVKKGSLSGSRRKRASNGTSGAAKSKTAATTIPPTQGTNIAGTGPMLTIQLERGITLTLSASADTFKMSPEDRTFVMEVLGMLESHANFNSDELDEGETEGEES
jgi:hypothetical protein